MAHRVTDPVGCIYASIFKAVSELACPPAMAAANYGEGAEFPRTDGESRDEEERAHVRRRLITHQLTLGNFWLRIYFSSNLTAGFLRIEFQSRSRRFIGLGP
ncbi:uncharacterized protein LOC144713260 [Wolffia australiana]